jgi:REP element-mobilizing transposase RayT
MSHAYTSDLFHIVFSTKERLPAVREPATLWSYLAGVARNLNYEPLAIGGTENHIHVLVRIPNNVTLAEAVQKLKSNSSRWLRENGRWLGWQKGYGAFSVSASNLEAVRRYIQSQPEHHRKHSFEDEFVTLLAKSGVALNRSEVFD